MSTTIKATFSILLLLCLSQGFSQGVFFSEYTEGSSGNNKAVEIYNGTATTIDLSSYKVVLANNGGGFGNGNGTDILPYEITLSGSLEAADVYVIGNGAAVAGITSVSDLLLSFGTNPGDRVAAFNGNDALGLYENGNLVDVFGDPTSSATWTVGSTGSSANFTLRRKGSITQGNITPLGSFGTTDENSEWEVFPDTDYSNLGVHALDGQTIPIVNINQTGFNGNFGIVAFPNASNTANYKVSGTDLTAVMVITPPAGFELSLTEAFSGTIYTNTSALSISPTDGTIEETTIYVRFKPTAADEATYNGDITHTSTDASEKTVAVSGVEGVLTNDLFISEYVEGSGSNKAIEIFNNSGSQVDLSLYSLHSYANGSSSSTGSIQLSIVSATLETDGVIVLVNSSSTDPTLLALADETSSNAALNFNGDDALALVKNGVIIDVFGEIGVDPGSNWEVGGAEGGSTVNQTLVRKPSVKIGNVVGLGSFGTTLEDAEWDTLTIDDFSNLGTHVINRDETAPVFEANFPVAENISFTSFDIAVQMDEAGKAYYVVLPASSAAPSVAQIMARTDAADQLVTLSGEIDVAAASTKYTASLSSLTNGTAYKVYVVAADDEATPNVQTTATVLDVTTLTIDVTAPAFATGYPAANTIGNTQFDLAVKLNEAGKVYYTVLSDGATAPTVNELKTGLDASGSAFSIAGTIEVTSGDTEFISVITGLVFSTAYDVYVVAEDAASTPNIQNAVSLLEFTTIMATDSDSDIAAADSPITTSSIASIADTEAEAVSVLNFKIIDLGSGDAFSTSLSEVVIVPGAGNTAVWSTTLEGATLSDGTTTSSSAVIIDGSITFTLNPAIAVADGATATFELAVYLKKQVTDNEVLQFSIPTNHGFGSLASGSGFVTTLANAIESPAITVGVTASAINVTSDAEVLVGEAFELSVSAVDANGNLDLDPLTVTLSTAATGVLSATSGLTQNTASGSYSWIDLRFDSEAIITITATAGNVIGNSPAIEVYVPNTSVFFSEYIEGSSNNKAIEIFNNSGKPINLADYSLLRYNNGSMDASDTLLLSEVTSTLPNQEVIVIANPSADAAILAESDLNDAITFFNGDDAMVLYHRQSIIDVFGKVGEDPGASWTVGSSGATANYTLTRKPGILKGNISGLGSFGTSDSDSEWEIRPIDFFGSIGSHKVENPGDPIITLDLTGFSSSLGEVLLTETSAASVFSVSAVDLTADLIVSAPSPFVLSSDGGTTKVASLALAPTSGSIAATSISVYFTPTTQGSYEGEIILASTSAITKTLSVSGTGVDPASLFYENFSECSAGYKFTAISTVGDQVWSCTDFGQTGAAIRMNGFSGGAQANEDYLVSDAISLATLEETAKLTFDSDVRFDGPALELLVSKDYTGDVTTANWVTLNAAFDTDAANNDTWTSSGDVFLDAFLGESIVIAFKYTSDATSGAAQWSVDNVSVAKAGFQPSFTVDFTGFNGDFGQQDVGTVSSAGNFKIEGIKLTGNVTVTPPSEFEVSTTDAFTTIGSASSPLLVSPVDGAISETIFVRFAPSQQGSFSGSILVVTEGYDAATISVSGTGEAVAVLASAQIETFNLYPIPTEDVLNIHTTAMDYTITILELSGREVLSAKNPKNLDLRKLNNGIYIVRLIDNKGKVLEQQRIVKK